MKFLLSVASGVLLTLLFVWYFTNIFLYIVFALVVSTILRPVVNYVSQVRFFGVGVPRVVSVLVSYVAMLVVISVFVFLFIPLISEQVKVLSSFDYDNFIAVALGPIEEIENFLIRHSLTSNEKGFVVEGIREHLKEALQGVNFSNVLNGIVSLTGSLFVGGMAVLFISFFLLLENGLIRKIFISMIPNFYFEVSVSAFYKIERLLTNYLLGLVFQMISIFSMVSLGLSVVEVNYALTVGVFSAFANLIPYMGPVLGALFGIVVGASTSTDLMTLNEYLFLMVKILSVFGAVQLIDNFFLQPVIFSKSVKAHPLEIFIIIFAGANLAGIPGMIGAIPCYTVLRVTWKELRVGYRQYYIFKDKGDFKDLKIQ
ncbi:AI-2E family transporter [Fulvitalea axinellae]|uniref:AI-2E family transporter n=1 Tax=Fulvitalea axinellae TaxID=1182444 RepID=UPI0030CA1ADF